MSNSSFDMILIQNNCSNFVFDGEDYTNTFSFKNSDFISGTLPKILLKIREIFKNNSEGLSFEKV